MAGGGFICSWVWVCPSVTELWSYVKTISFRYRFGNMHWTCRRNTRYVATFEWWNHKLSSYIVVIITFGSKKNQFFGNNSGKPQPVRTKLNYGTCKGQRATTFTYVVIGAIAAKRGLSLSDEHARPVFYPLKQITFSQFPSSYFHQIWPRQVPSKSIRWDLPTQNLKTSKLKGVKQVTSVHCSLYPMVVEF